ncbi:hypothetical protein ATO6_12260 [Oceanicola sp. 22II-s10i]|uniref:hypothetical protein n=1 Tax=Oceanicola sp. 22II-s10i TaxID=1317116 RepID=UPI000B528C2C|nr:hypothetical protein [Oceanicola sp. 22II-s10i]OWU84661.1 hypothetical protein ATO6_12260 [Oceanicola sp. 22II-s10i]
MLSAYGGITLEHGGCTVSLRPSLRAALHLERLHDGFPALLRKVEEFDTRTVRTIIEAAADKKAVDRFLTRAAALPLSGFKQAAQAPLYALVAAMLLKPDVADNPTAEAAIPMQWSEAYLSLFKFATGWLGWSPETAWSAVPQEISDAFHERIRMLTVIHGSATPEEGAASSGNTPAQRARNIDLGLDPEFDRAGLMALKGKGLF